MIFFRKRKLKAARAELATALALMADARERKDTRGINAAFTRLRSARHEVMRLEGFGV